MLFILPCCMNEECLSTPMRPQRLPLKQRVLKHRSRRRDRANIFSHLHLARPLVGHRALRSLRPLYVSAFTELPLFLS
jgi:hypothetical protein